MNRQERHLAIKQLISTRAVANQQELLKGLKKMGIQATQATLSRDLRDLGIARIGSASGSRYELLPETEERNLQPFIGYEILTVESNEAVVVVKTLPARAHGVAEFLDSLHLPLVLGTIAGDNTIMVMPVTTTKTRELLKTLKSIFTEEKKVA